MIRRYYFKREGTIYSVYAASGLHAAVRFVLDHFEDADFEFIESVPANKGYLTHRNGLRAFISRRPCGPQRAARNRTYR